MVVVDEELLVSVVDDVEKELLPNLPNSAGNAVGTLTKQSTHPTRLFVSSSPLIFFVFLSFNFRQSYQALATVPIPYLTSP